MYRRVASCGSFTAREKEEDPHSYGGCCQSGESKSGSPGAHYQSGGTASCSHQPHRARFRWWHREVAVIEVVQEEEYPPARQVTARNANRRTNIEGVGGHKNEPAHTASDRTHSYDHQYGIRQPRQPEHRQRGQHTDLPLRTCEQLTSRMADPAVTTGGTPVVSPTDTSNKPLLSDDGSRTKLSPDAGSPSKLSPDARAPTKLSPDAGSPKKLSPDSGSPTRLLSPHSGNYTAHSESEDIFPESEADVEERQARFRELKARLGSPAESVSADSVASGQFDDVETESLPAVGAGETAGGGGGAGRGTRSRTVSSGSDQVPLVHSPLQDLVIPLPDSTDVMWARYSSSDNLRDSPIALPDVTGYFSHPPSSTTGNCPVSTTGTGAHSYSDHSAPHLTRTSERTSPGNVSSSSPGSRPADKNSGRTDGGNTAPGTVGMGIGRAYPPSPLSREPYTPGSYLANRGKYYSRGGVDASHAASSVASESEIKSYFSSSESERCEGTGAKRAGGMELSVDAAAAEDAANILKIIPRTEQTAANLLNLNNKRETASTMYASSSDLRESLLRESLRKESTVRDSQARDSLVREVLAREAKEKDVKERPPPDIRCMEIGTWEQQVPVDIVLDKGRLSAIRDSLNTEFSSGAYSLKDYKNYVAKNYGQDEAARIRDRTPQPFTPTPASYNVATGLGHQEGPSYQPYYVSEEAFPTHSLSSDRDQDYLAGSRRGELDRGYDSYTRRGDSAANQRGYTSRGYDHQPRRAQSVTSDRSYSSYCSAGPRSSDNESSSSGEQFAGRPSSHAGQGHQGEGGQRQYQRSYSGDSARSASYRRQHHQQQQGEEKGEERTRRRRSLFDRPAGSLFSRDAIMDLLDDLFDNKPDKRSLWERHSCLLRDDDFCRDFFTRDWDSPLISSSLFDDDDFFKGRGRSRRSNSKRTETEETREEQGDSSGHVRRMRRTRSMESDLSGTAEREEAASSRQGTAGGRGSSQSSSSSQQQRQQYKNVGAPRDTHPASRIFNDPKFGAFGSLDEEEEARFKERGDRREGPTTGSDGGEKVSEGHGEGRKDNATRTQTREEVRGESRRGTGRGEGRGDKNSGRGEGRKDDNDDFWDKDTLFFRDYDDLIHRFKDLKWKSAMDSYRSNESNKKGQEPPSATQE